MNKIVSRGLWGVLFVAGLSVLGATAANAAETTGGEGTASGTQGVVSLGSPISVGGNAISLLGDASSTGASSTTASTTPASDGAASDSMSGPTTSGDSALASGTQAVVNGVLPIAAGGNAISVLGDSDSSGSSVGTTSGTAAPADGAATTTGVSGTASGTQLLPSATAPVGVSGNAISILGDANSNDSNATGSGSTGAESTGTDSTGTDSTGTESGSTARAATTSGQAGTLSGTQLAPAMAAPIGLSGNAISILGDSDTTETTAVADPGTPTVPTTPGETTGPVAGPAALDIMPISTLAFTGANPGSTLAVVAAALLTGGAMTIASKMTHRATK